MLMGEFKGITKRTNKQQKRHITIEESIQRRNNPYEVIIILRLCILVEG